MDQFKRIGVFLKNSRVDQAVLGFAAHLSKVGEHELFFAHVTNPNDPECGRAPSDAEFEQRVRDNLPEKTSANIHARVLKGDQIEQILRATRDEKLDLAIFGRKLPSSQLGLGTRITRIVRKTPCSVLVVPELCQPHFERLMVAVDCSEHSRMALESAINIASDAQQGRQVVAVNVRQISSGYDVAGATFQEAATNQINRGMKQLSEFLAGADRKGVEVEPLVLLSSSPALAITHAAMAKKMDIVIAGSRGASGTAAALLGSNSERLLATCALPTLIVKKQGETLSLLEALLSVG